MILRSASTSAPVMTTLVFVSAKASPGVPLVALRSVPAKVYQSRSLAAPRAK